MTSPNSKTQKQLKNSIKEMLKEYSNMRNMNTDLAIENYELKVELEDKNEIIKSLKSILESNENILRITEKYNKKFMTKIQLLEIKLGEDR